MAPILTLAIPTYNRADVLDETLRLMVSDPACDERVEIIVSDNCSTDHTSQVAAKYPSVRYYRNEENIRDANFTKILGYGTGLYLKLVNDTVRFESGMIEKMIAVISQTDRLQNNLLFYENCFLNENQRIEVADRKELLRQVSFYTTWTANFGIWRDDFMAMEDKDRYVLTQFLQVDWTYRMVSNGRPTLVVFDHYFSIANLKNKGGYNFYKVFVNNYFGLIRSFNLPKIEIECEKYRLFRYFLLYNMYSFRRYKDKFSFTTDGEWPILWAKYWYEPYFYLGVCAMYMKLFLNKTNKR